LRFEGAAGALLTDLARSALIDSEVVVIAPSNPLVSIGPIRALPEVDDLLSRRRDSVVAISPIVGGVAIKGPADRMMLELGHEPSVVGVAQLYAPIAATLVIDPVDEALVPAIEATGMRTIVTPSVMSDIEVGQQLARRALAAGRT
jgi:LPPG:FO 2-phospho-L-lactate transferase